MKFLIKIFSFVFIFFALILDTFAIDSPVNFKLDSLNNTTVNLSWDAVTD